MTITAEPSPIAANADKVALQELACEILQKRVVGYDGLDDRLRLAADVLIASKAVDTVVAPGGFMFMKPIGIGVLSMLRGQVGGDSLLHRLAAGHGVSG